MPNPPDFDPKLKAAVKEIKAIFKKYDVGGVVLTKLEEAYMWIGKAIRDEQIERNSKAELQESRGHE
jgi:hypothetical protein